MGIQTNNEIFRKMKEVKTNGTTSIPKIEVCWGDYKVQKSFWESLKYFLMTGKWVKEFVFKCPCINHKFVDIKSMEEKYGNLHKF